MRIIAAEWKRSKLFVLVFVFTCVAFAPVISEAQNKITAAATGAGSAKGIAGPVDNCGPDGSLCLFYGGNMDGRNGVASEENTLVSDARTYDDFDVPDGQVCTVTGVFGEFLVVEPNPWTSALWEVRSGVSVHDGGALVASGINAADKVPTGRMAFGVLEHRATVTVDPFDLGAGRYHLTVAPVGTGNGRAFVSTTSGLNGIGTPLANGNSFFDSTFFGFTFEDISDPTILGPGLWDFSFGVIASCVSK